MKQFITLLVGLITQTFTRKKNTKEKENKILRQKTKYLSFNKIRKHLEEVEGKYVHWNKTERGFTTMGGVYSIFHEDAPPVKYIRKLLKKYGIKETRKDIYRVNVKMTDEEYETAWKLVVAYIIKITTPKQIVNILSEEELLAFLDIATLVGRKRAIKILQKTLRVKEDGIIGQVTVNKLLKRRRTFLTDFIRNTDNFLQGLARHNKQKYGIYARGWHNRMKRLEEEVA